MHVDGFRFDLATTIGRVGAGDFSRTAPLFQIVNQDPVLSRVKLIAEPWDVGLGGYQVGNFPEPFREWNGKFRDGIRRYWKGDQNLASEIGYRLSGSADLYQGESNRNYLQQSFTHPEWATDADLTLLLNANSTFATAGDKSLNRTFQGVLTRTLYDDATQRVKEIRLYPIDLGYGEKLTRSGIPRRAADPIANLVLDRIVSLSGNSGLDIKKVTEDGYLIGVAEPR